MAKINKRAYVEVDIAAMVIIIIMLIFLTVAFSFMQNSIIEITSVKQRLNNDLFLMNVLRTPYDGNTVQEIILADYSNGDYSKTTEALNNIFVKAFGNNICWTLTVQGYGVKHDKDCEEMTDMDIAELDASVEVPYNAGEVKKILIRLQP